VAERVVPPAPGPLRAVVVVPGDKSLSHRALILSAMATGRSRIVGLGPGADVSATRRAVAAFGAEWTGDALVAPGIDHWLAPQASIDCGNSGTTMRLLAGALAGRPFPATLTGDASLRKRPMRRLLGPLGALGADIASTPAGTAPLVIASPGSLSGADVIIPIASAQVRSAFAIAALQAKGSSSIDSPPGFRDHTERWLAALELGRWTGATRFEIDPGPVPSVEYPIPGDPSSAAFLWTIAAIVPGSEVVTPGVSLNPGRIGFLDVLRSAGAMVHSEITGEIHGDPVGTVTVAAGDLQPVAIGGSFTVRTLDELPLVAVLAAYASGHSIVSDAGELRAKESDRITSIVEMVRSLGGVAEPTNDGFVVTGRGGASGGVVDSAGDHRIALAAGAAAAAASGSVTVIGAEAAEVSWPGYFDRLEELWSSR
jgi:3-phosphoshikimate 1-carboxyvinyltransferase